MTEKIKGQIVPPKMFPLRSATSADDVTITYCSQMVAILDLLSWLSYIFQKPSKTAKIDQEVIKINKLTWK